MTHRAWLRTAGRLGAGAVAGALVPTDLSRAGDLPPRVIDIEIRALRWELAPGKTVSALTYSGGVPGAEIRAREGERLRVRVKNSLDEPTTVHWHGVEVLNGVRYAAPITKDTVDVDPHMGSAVVEPTTRAIGSFTATSPCTWTAA